VSKPQQQAKPLSASRSGASSGSSFTETSRPEPVIQAHRSKPNQAPKRWGPLQAWKHHHKRSAKDGLAQVLKTPIQALFNALIIGIALALPAALFSIVGQLQSLNSHWQAQSEMSVFVQKSLAPPLLFSLQQRLTQDADVKSARLITPDEGLASLGEQTGAQDVVSFLKQNPLPPVITVQPVKGLATERLQALKQRLQVLPHVEEVLLDLEWIQKLNTLLALGQQLFWSLAVTFGVAVILVVGNTLRLAIERQREEIQVLKLCGGTDAFIRRPFLYSGALLGTLGGVTAVLLLGLAALRMGPDLQAFETVFAMQLDWQLLTFSDAVILVADGILLGLMGAWFAVSRYLDAIEPQ
jgi:cell division transport system permease protein